MFCSSIGSSKRYRLWTWQALAGTVLGRVLFHWACPHGRESSPLGPAVFASRYGQSGAWSPFEVGFNPPCVKGSGMGRGTVPTRYTPTPLNGCRGRCHTLPKIRNRFLKLGGDSIVKDGPEPILGCGFVYQEIL